MTFPPMVIEVSPDNIASLRVLPRMPVLSSPDAMTVPSTSNSTALAICAGISKPIERVPLAIMYSPISIEMLPLRVIPMMPVLSSPAAIILFAVIPISPESSGPSD